MGHIDPESWDAVAERLERIRGVGRQLYDQLQGEPAQVNFPVP